MSKYCILAAGLGTRNTCYIDLHKALLPIHNKPVIELILKNIPIKSEVIVAVGHLKEQLISILKQYDYNWKFVDVDFTGEGTGPGYSLLKCEKYLQEPFIFLTIDTIFEHDLTFNKNWVAFCKRPNKNKNKYCNLEFEFDNHSDKIFAGFGCVYNHQEFFDHLRNDSLINHQKELINSIKHVQPNIKYIDCLDTGNNESYLKTLEHFKCNTLKNDEFTYILNNKVIKFSNKEKTQNYYNKYNNYPFCPKVQLLNENMIYYDYIEGNLLSDISDINIFKKCIKMIFSTVTNENVSLEDISSMYKEKTIKRIKEIYNVQIINNYKVYTVYQIINQIDWSIFNNYQTCYFHGDLQPENIIVNNDSITFIDPRISFGNNKIHGDIYYELGKIYHALFVNGEIIRNNLYNVDNEHINFNIKYNLLEFKNILKKECINFGLDWNKVILSGLLQYINIYSLYKNQKYSEFLYKMGILHLSKFINGELDGTFN